MHSTITPDLLESASIPDGSTDTQNKPASSRNVARKLACSSTPARLPVVKKLKKLRLLPHGIPGLRTLAVKMRRHESATTRGDNCWEIWEFRKHLLCGQKIYQITFADHPTSKPVEIGRTMELSEARDILDQAIVGFLDPES